MTTLSNLHDLVDDRLCCERGRKLPWFEGVKCPFYQNSAHKRRGYHSTYKHRYQSKSCPKYFDDLANTILKGIINL